MTNRETMKSVFVRDFAALGELALVVFEIVLVVVVAHYVSVFWLQNAPSSTIAYIFCTLDCIQRLPGILPDTVCALRVSHHGQWHMQNL
jgi:hypothetical protein